jgi:hypothetical protein
LTGDGQVNEEVRAVSFGIRVALARRESVTIAPPVYRVLQKPMPSRLADIRAEEYRYGARILYVDGPPPAEPVSVDGTVIHSTLVEVAHYVGSHNPLLEHLEALQRIENDKFFEAELIRSVAPEAMARTELVGRIWRKPADLDPYAYLAALEQAMSARYPRGFVLKPIAGFAADGRFPSECTPFAALWAAYKTDVEPEITRLQGEGMDASDLHYRLRNAPAYPGRILDALLDDPESVMIQERIEIAASYGAIEEYRVHVVGGRVLAGATQHRWGHYRSVSLERIAQVEAFVQDLMSKLPAPYFSNSELREIDELVLAQAASLQEPVRKSATSRRRRAVQHDKLVAHWA